MYSFDFDFSKMKSCITNEIDKPSLDECKALYELSELNFNRKKLYHDILEKTTKIEYATGGSLLHRGYYSPSIFATIAVGGCNRGKLLSRITRRSMIINEYYYINNDLSMIMNYEEGDAHDEPYSIEFIQRKDDIEIGLSYQAKDFKRVNLTSPKDDFGDVKTITVCQFSNGRLINSNYYYGLFSWEEYNPDADLVESFSYEKDVLYYKKGKLIRVEYLEGSCRPYTIGDDSIDLHKISDDNDFEEMTRKYAINIIFNEDGFPTQYFEDDDPYDRTYDFTKNNLEYYKKMFME